MIVLVGLYVDASADRMREFLTCIERNAANRKIAAVHVFVEDALEPSRLAARYPQLASPKVRLVRHGRRVTYRDLFAYANRELRGRRDFSSPRWWFSPEAAGTARPPAARRDLRRSLCHRPPRSALARAMSVRRNSASCPA